MTEVEVVEGEVEVLPAPRSVELNLFGGGEPTAVVERATVVARALADVIEQQNLYTVISNRKHVRVEGWTLLGSMLGVFPIVEWTRQLEPGVWEARCVAKTLGGEEVGAAEAMCSVKESRWKGRDEYAIRSMAQTRATSKALRLPLGFVMALAGYDVTPLEEMDARGDTGVDHAPSGADSPQEPQEFNPEADSLPNAIKGEGQPQRLADAFRSIDPTVDWRDVVSQIPGGRDSDFWRRYANVEARIRGQLGEGDFPPATEEMIVAAFAEMFSGITVTLPRHEPAPLPSDQPVEVDETVPFGGGAYGEDA